MLAVLWGLSNRKRAANPDENAATKFLESFAAGTDQDPSSPQTIKQHLAAIKMLFDYLVISQVVPH